MWGSVKGKQVQPTDILVDDDGRFEVLGMLPELKVSAQATTSQRTVGRVFQSLVIMPGEDRDLGNIVIERPTE